MAHEKSIEKQMRKYVKSIGGKFYKWVSPGEAGVPDRICIMPSGDILFFEVKKPGGELSALQVDMIEELKCSQCNVYVVDNIDSFIAIIDWWR